VRKRLALGRARAQEYCFSMLVVFLCVFFFSMFPASLSRVKLQFIEKSTFRGLTLFGTATPRGLGTSHPLVLSATVQFVSESSETSKPSYCQPPLPPMARISTRSLELTRKPTLGPGAHPAARQKMGEPLAKNPSTETLSSTALDNCVASPPVEAAPKLPKVLLPKALVLPPNALPTPIPPRASTA
jgi:hypothetical protein